MPRWLPAIRSSPRGPIATSPACGARVVTSCGADRRHPADPRRLARRCVRDSAVRAGRARSARGRSRRHRHRAGAGALVAWGLSAASSMRISTGRMIRGLVRPALGACPHTAAASIRNALLASSSSHRDDDPGHPGRARRRHRACCWRGAGVIGLAVGFRTLLVAGQGRHRRRVLHHVRRHHQHRRRGRYRRQSGLSGGRMTIRTMRARPQRQPAHGQFRLGRDGPPA